MGLWKEHFHWSVLLRWEVLGWILAAFLTIAGIFLFFEQYQGANVCFMVTALFTLAKVVHVAVVSQDNLIPRLLFTFVLFGLLGVAVTETIKGVSRWAEEHRKEPEIAQPLKPPDVIAPPSSEPKKVPPKLDKPEKPRSHEHKASDEKIPERWIIEGNRFSKMGNPEICKEAHNLAARMRQRYQQFVADTSSLSKEYEEIRDKNPNASDSQKQEWLSKYTFVRGSMLAKFGWDYQEKFQTDGILLLEAMMLRAPAGTARPDLVQMFETPFTGNPGIKALGDVREMPEKLDMLAQAIETGN